MADQVTDPARDEAFMQAAIALARRGLGRTAPNPSVAALVVDERFEPPVMLGRGLTAPGGRPHAEALAMGSAAASAAVTTDATQLCRPEDVMRLLRECTVSKV